MHKDIKAGDVIEYFGVRYLVLRVNSDTYTCIDGYNFQITEVKKGLTAGFRKVEDIKKLELSEVVKILFSRLERKDIE